MNRIFQALLFLSFLHTSNLVYSQDFFEEEQDSVLWFYDTKPHIAVVYTSTPTVCPYGAALWVHHAKHKFSSYFECKANFDKNSSVKAYNYNKSYYKEITGSELVLKSGIGFGSTIFENYLWYFNIGVAYSHVNVPYDILSYSNTGQEPFKMDEPSPFAIHWGGGIAAVFLDHFHVQVGVDLETMNLTGGLGFVF